MPYDRESAYFTWGGSMGSTPEIWQCGVHLCGPTPVGTAAMPTSAQLAALGAQLETQFASSANPSSNAAKLKWFKVAHLNTLGEYLGDPVWISTTNIAGIVSPNLTILHPYQVCAVTSLYSGSNFGRANHGRFYWPAPSMGINTDGVVSGTMANVANFMGTWLKTIENAAAAWTPGVQPMKVRIMSKAGETKDVKTVYVDNVLDTQRRRRNKLQPVNSVATTYPG